MATANHYTVHGRQTKSEETEVESKSSTTYYKVGLVIGIVVFIISLYVAHKHHLSGLQLTIFRDLNNLSNSYKTAALWLTEGLGAGYAIAICVIVPLLFKRFKLAWLFFVAAAAGGVLLEIGKHIAKEPRPAVVLAGNLHIRATELGLNSFPSGHAVIATTLAMVLWLILPRRWRWVCLIWIIIVGLSRIYLGDHTPNDVIGGIAVGVIVVSILKLLPTKLAHKVHLDNLDQSLLKPGF